MDEQACAKKILEVLAVCDGMTNIETIAVLESAKGYVFSGYNSAAPASKGSRQSRRTTEPSRPLRKSWKTATSA